MLARTAVFASDRGDATRIAHAALQDLTPDLVDERQALAGLERISAYMHGLTDHDAGPAPEVVGTGAGARALAAALSWEELCRGEDRERAVDLARFALEQRILQEADPGLLWVVAAMVLGMSGEDTTEFWDVRAPARLPDRRPLRGARGAPVGRLRAVAARRPARRPAVDGAVHRAERAVGVQLRDRPVLRRRLHDLHAARQGLPRGGPARRGPRRGRVPDRRRLPAVHGGAGQGRAHPGRPPAGAGDPRVGGRRGDRDGEPGLAALALDARPGAGPRSTGSTRPSPSPTEELVLARRWGAPALVGKTLLVLADLQGRPGTVPPRPWSRRRSPCSRPPATGSTWPVPCRCSETGSRPPTRTGPAPCSAGPWTWPRPAPPTPCARPSRRGWPSSGSTYPRVRGSGRALTASERRIAELAADGAAFQEIAQSLFVTTRTVTTIVGSVSERLGAASPHELRAALDRLPAG